MAMEDLEVRVRERALGNVSEPSRIHADPDDIPALMRHLEVIARDWGGHAPDNGWLTEYELLVTSLERPWLEFAIAGDPSIL